MVMANHSDQATIIGVFHDHIQADRAVCELRLEGFREDQIGVAGRHPESIPMEEMEVEGTHAGTGALAGALAGAGLGGLVGLGVLAGAIPVIGPVIAGGTLAAMLANTAGGAALGGLAGALIGSGIPEDEASYYGGEFEAGHVILTVRADGRYGEAASILRRHGAHDMQTRDTAAMGEQTLPVLEEKLRVQKEPIKTGEASTRKDAVTEHKTMEVPVRHEEVVVERHPASGERHAAPGDIGAGQKEIRVPVTQEQISAEKQPVVKEDVSVRKQAVQGTEHVGANIRKEQVRVEREGDVNA